MKKICVLMWYDSTISEYADINRKINTYYCDTYGFTFIHSNERTYEERHPAWERIPLLLKYIHDFDYVIWIDADAFFYVDSPSILEIIDKNPDAPMIFSRDHWRDNDNEVNSGFLIVKNHNYSIDFLNEWGYNEELYKNNSKPIWWDQGVLLDMQRNNVMNIQKHRICHEYGVLQHIYDYELAQFPKKPFVWHSAGEPKEKRIHISTTYYNQYKHLIEKGE